MKQLSITTDDGVCPAYEYGAGPSVLLYIDGLGMRPAMHAIGERLGAAGYRVLVPDLFWRMGAYTAPDATKVFTDPAIRADWWTRVRGAASSAWIMSDTRAFLDALPGPVAITGYCMGGRMAISAAATYPDRVVAAAAYHPGGLATDADDSPHRLASQIKARLYIGAASEDPSFSDEEQARFRASLDAAHVAYQLEVYPAKHGWVPNDTAVHDAAAAERHWQTLEAVLASTLRK
ncbi:MAG: dienelactone hydrolase family protein [Deltaproteobacteria bacterium]|nr:dienelactone hydrolase family protein [Deltaproteobacteria bacterium]